MDLIVDSDIYEPCIDEKGNYSDYLPSSNKFKNGLRCNCGSRREHILILGKVLRLIRKPKLT